MNNERSFLKKYNIIPTGYEYKDNVKIIETKKGFSTLKKNLPVWISAKNREFFDKIEKK